MTIRTILNNACNEDEAESVGWDQALQWGKKAKNGIKKEKYRRAKGAQRYPFPCPDYLSARFAHRFFFLFPTIQSLVPGYWKWGDMVLSLLIFMVTLVALFRKKTGPRKIIFFESELLCLRIMHLFYYTIFIIYRIYFSSKNTTV